MPAVLSRTARAVSGEYQGVARDHAALGRSQTVQPLVIGHSLQIQHSPAGAAAEMGMGPSHRVKAGHRAVQLCQPPLPGHLLEIAVHGPQAQPGHLRLQLLIDHLRRGMGAALQHSLVDPLPLLGKTLRHRLSSLNSNNYYYLYIISCWKMQALFQNSDNIRLSGAGGNFRC